MRLAIKSSNYREQQGFLLYGSDNKGRSIRIWSIDRPCLEDIRNLYKSATEPSKVDMLIDARLLQGETRLKRIASNENA